jgi:urease accessory protein
VPFADNASAEGVRRALLLGYMLGNQHAPLEVSASEVRTPLLTSESTARQVLSELGLTGEVRAVELAARGWTNTSADPHGAADPHRGDPPLL